MVGPKVLTLGPSLLHKQSNPSKVFQAVFLTARVLPLLRILALLDNTGGSKDLKTSQKGLFRGYRIGTENFGNFYLKNHKSCSDEIYHNYVSS